MSNFEKYTPVILKDKATFVLQLSTCGICGRKMLGVTRRKCQYINDLFPWYYKNNLESQMKRAGIVFRSNMKDKNDCYIYENCAKEGKSTFICALCGKERSSDQIVESFGDPPEHLCKICYKTVSAEVWEKKKQELYNLHRWDFE